MKAAVYTKAKSGKVLEIERPVPKNNEVVIRVRAASVNPLGWRMKSQKPGVDVAGEVVEVGRTVTQFKPGQAVFHLSPQQFFGIAFWIGFSINTLIVEVWLRSRGGASQIEKMAVPL